MGEWDFLYEGLEELSKIAKEETEREDFDIDRLTDRLMGMDSLKELREYNKSEENLKNCEPFEKMNQRYIALHKQYKDSFEELFQNIEERACRREYASGGLGFPRGFYSPSIMDLVVVGVNRGRLLKRTPKKGKCTYEYLFDANDDLICVYNYAPNRDPEIPCGYELFVRDGDSVLSFYYEHPSWGGYKLKHVTECVYEDGKLKEYRFASCSLIGYGKHGNNCSRIEVEIYDYKDGLIEAFHYYRYMPPDLLAHDIYTFDRDEEGNLSTFMIEYFDEYARKNKVRHISGPCKVRGRRK